MRHLVLVLLGLSLFVGEARAQSNDAILDTVQHASFQYFWDQANPANGLIKDRSTPTSPASTAAVGFGLSAICVGVDHGWVTRDAAKARVLTTLDNLWVQPQGTATSGTIGYKGLYYHFLDMNTSLRTWTSELSTIDTALLFAGIIDCRTYFTGADSIETQIRALSDSITQRADWAWTRGSADTTQGIRMAWTPESGFSSAQWVGYNEAMIMYLIALGSPTHPVGREPGGAWSKWMSGYLWLNQFGYAYVNFPPLFGHQYSHCWVDFRYIQDAYMRFRGITYFENSFRATLAQRNYAIANPSHFAGYSDSLWGLTASDVPSGYNARGAPPALNDDGTITPTAPVSSIAFAPDWVMPVIRNLYLNYPQAWGPYGFVDAFNLQVNWWDTDYLGIDEGPIVLMIENYRNHKVWDRFNADPDIVRGLAAAGFTFNAGMVGVPPTPVETVVLERTAPNPFRDAAAIRFRLANPADVTLSLFDLQGREVARLADGLQSSGLHTVTVPARGLASGIYYIRLRTGGRDYTQKCVRVE